MAAGKVETSQRITDVVLARSLRPRQAHSGRQFGDHDNSPLSGGTDPVRRQPFALLRTIAGGWALPRFPMVKRYPHAHDQHWNTPVEGLRASVSAAHSRHPHSSGPAVAGNHRGGDGIIRQYEFLTPAQ